MLQRMLQFQVQIRQQMPTLAPRPQSITALPQSLSSLPPGTTIIQGSQSLPGVQGFALVPAQYVTQVSCASLGVFDNLLL